MITYFCILFLYFQIHRASKVFCELTVMDKKEARRSIMLLLMEIDYILRYGNLCDDSAKKLNDNTLHDFTSDFDSNKDELESPKDKYICNVNSNVESFFSKKENNEKSTLELDGLKFSSGKEVHELSTTHDKSDAGTHDNQSECLTSYQHLSKQFCPAMEILNSATLENPLNDKLVDTKKALSASIDKTFEHLINPNDPVKCTSKDLGVDQANLLMKLESSINVSAKEFGHCDAKDIQSCSAMKSASSETTEKISSITQEHRADKSNTSSQTCKCIFFSLLWKENCSEGAMGEEKLEIRFSHEGIVLFFRNSYIITAMHFLSVFLLWELFCIQGLYEVCNY